jgi:DNA-binding Lrp family transcriptional regulator
MKLDKTDTMILTMLSQDARISFREIARVLKISPDTVSHRVDHLMRKGIILSSTVIIDPSKIGYTFITRFSVNVKPSYAPQVLEKIIKIPSVIIASKVVGSYDVIAIAVAKDFEHLSILRDTILSMPYVENVDVGMWMHTLQISPKYFLI